jgi:electron transfer flavoprotein alpha subunit
MHILVYAESDQGIFKKSTQELISFARAIADQMNTEVVAAVTQDPSNANLGQYGAHKVLNLEQPSLTEFNAELVAEALTQAARATGASTVIVSSSANSRYMAPLLAVALEAGYVPNVVGLPQSYTPLTVAHNVFTNKATAFTSLQSSISILGLSKNAYGVHHYDTSAEITKHEVTLNPSSVEVISLDKASNKVMIADAEVVVSAGRGLKGPENWGMIEELAEVMGAATACSKPVSDLGWRPHSEHVGQTGKPVASNLYIAIGISGAIQHLAGINSSKVKVVINTDPEAPFFKAADYGIVGDAFEVVPDLIQKLKEFKAQNA